MNQIILGVILGSTVAPVLGALAAAGFAIRACLPLEIYPV